MKTVRIKDEEVGLVYRKGEFDRLLTKGKYWVRSSDVVTICNTNEQFTPEGDLKKLLKHEELAVELTVVELTETQVALMYEYGNFSRLLSAGTYAFWKDEKRYHFSKHDRSLPFNPSTQLSVLLKNEALADELIIAEVKEEQIALLFVDGIFASVLSPGKYAFWKGVKSYDFQYIDVSSTDLITDIKLNILMKREVLSYIRVFEVLPSELGVLFIDGKYVKTLKSGTYYFWINATPIAVFRADIRQVALEVSGQEILTKDKAGLRVNFQVLYKVTDIEKALIDNKDFEKQLYTLVQLALREFVSTYTLDELLEKKDEIGEYVKTSLAVKADALGVKINAAGVKDVILPGDMKDIMNQVLIAQKKAQANVIMRREETASTRSLLNTAKLMEDNEVLFRLKEMEYMEKIAEKIGDISIGSNGQVIEQLRGIFSVNK